MKVLLLALTLLVASSDCTYSFKLLGNSTMLHNSGLLLVRSGSGSWGTVCDDAMNVQTASRICVWMGYTRALSYRYAGSEYARNRWNFPIYLDNLVCPATATSLSSCRHNTWGSHNCGTVENVLLTCSYSDFYEWKLLGVNTQGVASATGVLQVKRFDTHRWGTVCATGFTAAIANDVCKWIGYTRAVTYTSTTTSASVWRSPIHLAGMTCPGTAQSISDCTHYGWGTASTCTGNSVVSLSCSISSQQYEWRMYTTSGQLQVRMAGGSWGSVCDDMFDTNTAHAVCRWMGHSGATSWSTAGRTLNNINIHLDDFRCPSGATDFSQCHALPWGRHNCSHPEDVILRCRALSG